MKMSLFLDIATIVVILSIIYTSYRKGLIRSIIELVGYVASLAVSYTLSIPAGQWIYRTFLEPAVNNAVRGYINRTIGNYATTQTSQAINTSGLTTFLNKVPDDFKSLLGQYNLSIDTVKQISTDSAHTGGNAVASAVTTQIVAPIAQSISHTIAFAVIFAICMVVVRYISRVANGANRIPIFGTINRMGGACVGFVMAAVDVFFLCTVVGVFVSILALQPNPILTVNNINSTQVFKIFYNHNPFTPLLLNK